MPIVFEQPSPMSPATSIGGGRADVATKDFPSIAGLYESGMRNQLQASQATAQMGLQAQETNAQLSQRQGELAVHQQEAAADRQSRETMLAVQGHQQQVAQVQHANLQAWLQGQELSQAESMQLQRMQGAVGQVQADPSLSDEDKMDLITQLKTGIDPLRQRQERMKTNMMQQQQEAMQHQNAAAETMQQQDMAFAAGNLDKLPLVTDPNTGKQHRMLRDKNGKWYDPFEGAGGGQKLQEHELDQRRQDEKHFNDAYSAAQKDVDAWETPRAVGDGKYQSRAQAELGHPPSREDLQKRFSAILAERTGGSSSLEQHQQQRAEARQRLRNPPERIAAPTRIDPTAQAPGAGAGAMAPPPAPRKIEDDEAAKASEILKNREREAAQAKAKQDYPNNPEAQKFATNPSSWSPELDAWLHRRGL